MLKDRAQSITICSDMSFFIKGVRQGDHLGEDIKELRIRAGLTLEEAAQKTKIVPSLLRAWEEGRWDAIGQDRVQLERIFRQYIQFYGAREAYFLKQYQDALKKAGITSFSLTPLRDTHPLRAFDVAWMARVRAVLGVGLVFAGVGLYLVAQARGISAAPLLLIDGESDAVRVTEPHVHFSGQTTPEAKVLVNGREAIMQPDGHFFIDLDIPRGTTEVTIVARRRYGKEISVVRRVIFERTRSMEKQIQEL